MKLIGMMNKDFTVIIPVHEYDDEIKVMLQNAIKSVPTDIGIIISSIPSVVEKMSNIECSDNVAIMGYDVADKNFCNLVNAAIDSINTKYFSILEYDDEYTDIWFKHVEEYVNFYPEVSAFLPLTELVDFTSSKFIGYGNEAPWASSFSNEIGYIDNDALQQFFDFYLTGSVFNKEDWKNLGGLKQSMKLTFWYEYLLRATNKGKKFFVIPKLGYRHIVNRKNSLFDVYRQTISEEESGFWFDLAKQESFFKEDRNKTYENNTNEGE